MVFDILTIFPELFESVFRYGVLRRAIDRQYITVRIHDLRDFTEDVHRKVDDRPYGGGEGMVMKPEPIFRGVEAILERHNRPRDCVRAILLSPAGRRYLQEDALRLSRYQQLVLICGRYEGVDQRVADRLADEEISVGDYVLTGGEVPAMILVDSIARLQPDVLGCEVSAQKESFCKGLLEHPQYTRPAEFRGMRVPEVLLSGDHEEIQRWRDRWALERTRARRPDLA
ncbi:MAG: tRNA (guanosine(37)-N1)-methyltransferase TrmD [Acidobacteria bacterium]|nr:tRNA (guanosine(37)-N1)-methyltransferase TrmD [Acidobacteriota bacterium]